MPLTKLAAMATTFSLSVPVGIFIGVGVSVLVGDTLSNTTLWTLGAFDGLSGACCLTRYGLLLLLLLLLLRTSFSTFPLTDQPVLPAVQEACLCT